MSPMMLKQRKPNMGIEKTIRAKEPNAILIIEIIKKLQTENVVNFDTLNSVFFLLRYVMNDKNWIKNIYHLDSLFLLRYFTLF